VFGEKVGPVGASMGRGRVGGEPISPLLATGPGRAGDRQLMEGSARHVPCANRVRHVPRQVIWRATLSYAPGEPLPAVLAKSASGATLWMGPPIVSRQAVASMHEIEKASKKAIDLACRCALQWLRLPATAVSLSPTRPPLPPDVLLGPTLPFSEMTALCPPSSRLVPLSLEEGRPHARRWSTRSGVAASCGRAWRPRATCATRGCSGATCGAATRTTWACSRRVGRAVGMRPAGWAPCSNGLARVGSGRWRARQGGAWRSGDGSQTRLPPYSYHSPLAPHLSSQVVASLP
jgi:hypothetical protein